MAMDPCLWGAPGSFSFYWEKKGRAGSSQIPFICYFRAVWILRFYSETLLISYNWMGTSSCTYSGQREL